MSNHIPTFKNTAEYVFENFLKHPYDDDIKNYYQSPSDQNTGVDLLGYGGPAVFPGNKNDPRPKINRPNHGIAHTLRAASYVRKVVEYYQKFGKNSEQFNFTEDQIKQLEIAMLFSVSGRKNDVGWSGDFNTYIASRRLAGDRFETYCRDNQVFSSEAELQQFKKNLVDMGNPANKDPLHLVIRTCHNLDLLRCFTPIPAKEAIFDFINENSAHKYNKNMLELLQFAVRSIKATGNKVKTNVGVDFTTEGDRTWAKKRVAQLNASIKALKEKGMKQLSQDDQGYLNYYEKKTKENPNNSYYYTKYLEYLKQSIHTLSPDDQKVFESDYAELRSHIKHYDPKIHELQKEAWFYPVWDEGTQKKYAVQYDYDVFYPCSTDPKHCMDILNQVKAPEFIKNEFDHKKEREDEISAKSLGDLIHQGEGAIRLLNTSLKTTKADPKGLSKGFHYDYQVSDTNQFRALNFEFDELVEPSTHRFIPFKGQLQHLKNGARKYYRDQQTGKLYERDFKDYVPLDQQAPITQAHDMDYYWDKDGNPIIHSVSKDEDRGKPKNTIFTKKHSYSLLRQDGKIAHYKGPMATRKQYIPIGTLSDVKELHQKGQRYIWDSDTRTSEKPYTGNMAKDQQSYDPRHPDRNHGLSLKALQDKYQAQVDNGIPANWYNEMLMGGSVQSLRGLFATENSILHRLHLAFTASRVQNEYNISLPTLIIDGQNKPALYTKAHMKSDLLYVLQRKPGVSGSEIDAFNQLRLALINNYRWCEQVSKIKTQEELVDLMVDYINPVVDAQYLSQQDADHKDALKPAQITYPSFKPKTPKGHRAATVAARAGDLATLKKLAHSENALDRDFNLADSRGYTPLHYAALCGHTNVVKFLLSHNVNPGKLGPRGHSPLSFAQNLGHKEITDLLTQRKKAYDAHVKKAPRHIKEFFKNCGFDLNDLNKVSSKKKGESMAAEQTPLTFALKSNVARYDIVRWCLANGADINLENQYAQGRNPHNPLRWLASYKANHDNDIQTLFGHDIEPDVNFQDSVYGYTALMQACYSGNEKMVEFLLAHPKTDLSLKNKKGQTALDVAIQRANVHDTSAHILSIMQSACGLKNQSKSEAEQFIKDNGFKASDLNTQNASGHTPLTLAIAQGRLDMVHYLVDKDVNVNLKNKNGQSPLEMLLKSTLSNWDTMDILWALRKKSNLNLNVQDSKTGNSLLTQVALSDNPLLFDYLLNQDAIHYHTKNKQGLDIFQTLCLEKEKSTQTAQDEIKKVSRLMKQFNSIAQELEAERNKPTPDLKKIEQLEAQHDKVGLEIWNDPNYKKSKASVEHTTHFNNLLEKLMSNLNPLQKWLAKNGFDQNDVSKESCLRHSESSGLTPKAFATKVNDTQILQLLSKPKAGPSSKATLEPKEIRRRKIAAYKQKLLRLKQSKPKKAPVNRSLLKRVVPKAPQAVKQPALSKSLLLKKTDPLKQTKSPSKSGVKRNKNALAAFHAFMAQQKKSCAPSTATTVQKPQGRRPIIVK